jgi:hypothetical protein
VKWQTTVVVAILLALAGGFYAYDVTYLEPKREKGEREKNRIWTLEPKDVEEVVIKRAQDTVRLKRAGEGWQILEPVAAPGSRGPIDDVLSNIVNARMDREVADKPANLGEFGLDKPEAEVRLTVRGKAETFGLGLGAKSPTGAWVYAKKLDSPAVFVLPETLLTDATKPASDFRDRTILAFDGDAVTALRIASPEETIDLERPEPKKWRIVKPIALAADADVLSAFLDTLQSSKVKEFVAEKPASLAPYGLDRPIRVKLVTGTDKDRAEKTLLFGRLDAHNRGVYAMRSGETSVLLLEEPLWTKLPKNVAVLRDKTVIAFDRDKLARIEIESPKGKVALARQGNRWRITAPEALPGDTPVINGLLFQLREMKAQAFLPGVHFTPTVKVSLWEGDAKTPKVVTLAPSQETRGGQPSAYAEAAGQGAVLVEARSLADLSKSAADLRDHMLFSEVLPRDVTRVRVKRGAKTAVFERTGPAGWKMVEPTRGAAKTSAVDDLVATVTALRWNEMLADGRDAKKYGFDDPSLEVTLFKGDGAPVAAVTVGKRDGRRYYVRAKGAVYTVDTTRLGPPPKVPEDFQG